MDPRTLHVEMANQREGQINSLLQLIRHAEMPEFEQGPICRFASLPLYQQPTVFGSHRLTANSRRKMSPDQPSFGHFPAEPGSPSAVGKAKSR